MPRAKHKLPPVTWHIMLELMDDPDFGETYLTKEQVEKELLNTGNLSTGVSFLIRSVVLQEES